MKIPSTAAQQPKVEAPKQAPVQAQQKVQTPPQPQPQNMRKKNGWRLYQIISDRGNAVETGDDMQV